MKIQKHVFSWESDESQKIFLRHHRRDPEQAKVEVKKILDFFRLEPPGKVLDVGCGLGYHLLAFEQHGFSGVGIDISDLIISEAKNNCVNSSSCQIIKIRASEMQWKNEFDLVCALGVPLGFMDLNEVQSHIEKMWEAVKPNGAFLLNVPYSLESAKKILPVNKWEIIEGKYSLTDKRILNNNIKREHFIIIDPSSDQIDEWYEEQRYFSGDAILDLLKQCGVEEPQGLVDIDGTIAANGENATFFIARKE
jgi:SAM-dependent methyltransferase